jgi:predicted RNA-binding Zn-ribbon protein involved in translation (DUF1610 family)
VLLCVLGGFFKKIEETQNRLGTPGRIQAERLPESACAQGLPSIRDIQVSGIILSGASYLEWTGRQIQRQIDVVGQTERPTCPNCGATLILVPPSGSKRRRTFQCEKCEAGDPLKSDKASGWVRSAELQPPK